MTPPTYLPLLTQLDRWQATAQSRHPGVFPCRSGCTACCHGPFDISVADAALVAVALNQLEPSLRAEVIARAEAQLAAMKPLEPSWSAPYDIAAIGEARFDQLSDDLAGLPCPALDAEGACTIYEHRPFVCRVMGLGMVIESGDVIENACPIQDQFPAYAALPPEPFRLEAFEVGEDEAKIAAARRLFGDESRFGYETTVAAAIATWRGTGPAGSFIPMNALNELIHGKGSHVDPVVAVDDLPWELAGRRVTHLPHTIWQQLGHLNYWMDFGLKAIEGARPELPEHDAASWPKADGPADELTWQHEVALLRTNLDQMTTLADARASTLTRIVNPKSGTTVESVLWQLVAHNSYHCGQIVLLRHSLGSWPPAAGGLTW